VHKRLTVFAVLVALWALAAQALSAEDRFPRPEFESGYRYPEEQAPLPRDEAWAWIDLGLLAAAIALGAWFGLYRKSRPFVLGLSVACLAYFGFIRHGCVCPVGSLQNVAEALARPEVALPLPVYLAFSLPIAGSLLWGRAFCAAACPLGGLQELVLVRPVRVPAWLDEALSILPAAYLGIAASAAASGLGYLICRFDPFVGFFRLSMSPLMLWISGGMLLLSVFVGRPYCRWLCPYGLILRATSLLARKKPEIARAGCVDCALCEPACRYGAIEPPRAGDTAEAAEARFKALRGMAWKLPAAMLLGAALGLSLAGSLGRAHPDVALLEALEREGRLDRASSPATKAFLSTGRPLAEAEAAAAEAMAGLSLGLALSGAGVGAYACLARAKSLAARPSKGRRIRPSKCVGCASCYARCPVEPGPGGKSSAEEGI